MKKLFLLGLLMLFLAPSDIASASGDGKGTAKGVIGGTSSVPAPSSTTMLSPTQKTCGCSSLDCFCIQLPIGPVPPRPEIKTLPVTDISLYDLDDQDLQHPLLTARSGKITENISFSTPLHICDVISRNPFRLTPSKKYMIIYQKDGIRFTGEFILHTCPGQDEDEMGIISFRPHLRHEVLSYDGSILLKTTKPISAFK